VRLRKHDLHHRFNGNLRIEFGPQKLTPHSGLELFRRYFFSVGLKARINRAFKNVALGGDFGVARHILVFIALWLTGGSRLRHIRYLKDDLIVQRFCGLKTLPSDRSMSRWLGRFTGKSLQALGSLNADLVVDKLRELKLPRVTMDFDGTILSCGKTVKWSARGYNPGHRDSKSYFPLLCHVSQTGHFLQVKNRPGNHHDSRGALYVIRSCVAQARAAVPRAKIEARLDSAFFKREIIEYFNRSKVGFVVKMVLWSRSSIKSEINETKVWHQTHIAGLSWTKKNLFITRWGKSIEVIVYRKKISDQPGGSVGHQLDLFSPDDGIYEYYALHTNMTLEPGNLSQFYNGRCAMEHQIAEIKQEFGFDVVPTKQYAGNSAHQQISAIAYNLVRNFQIDTEIASERPRTKSRTNCFEFQSLKTIRFELIAAAGRVVNIAGAKVLRLNHNIAREQIYSRVGSAIDRLAA
jgi:hypothetical protein